MKKVHGYWLPDGDIHFAKHLDKEVERYGTAGYQTKKWLAALPFVKKKRLAIDVGAHVGFWTIPMAIEFEHVIAYEPVAHLVECLRANISSRERHNSVMVRDWALGDQSSMAVAMDEPADNSGNAKVAIGRAGTTPMSRLDDLSLDALDFLKIDVEGYEKFVLLGGQDLIRRLKPVIVVEQKPGNASHYGLGDTEAVDLLKSWGAKVAWEMSGDFCMVWSS